MMTKIAIIGIVTFLILIPIPVAPWTNEAVTPPPANIYYITPTGNDSNNGTSLATAWASPNHSVNCGDVIYLPAGAYNAANFNSGKWGIVSNCPSSSGVYFAQLICNSPYVQDCSITTESGSAMYVTASHWAVIGVTATASGKYGACFGATTTGHAAIAYVAFINVYAKNCSAGVGSGPTSGHGVDYIAYVGVISYGGAYSHGECFSGVSIYEPYNYDTKLGTHVFAAGIFSINNVNPKGCTDGEGFIFDDWSHTQSNHIPYTGQGVLEQSMFLGNGSDGIEIFNNGAAPIYIFNVTTYGNLTDPTHKGLWGELLLNIDQTVGSTVKNSIFQANIASQNGNLVYGLQTSYADGTNAVSGNYIFGVREQNTDVTNNRSLPRFALGSNTYTSPNFVNPTIPSSAPDCSTSTTTTECMASVIANFTPQAAGAAGLGYQPPGSCTAYPYYPAWLKGIVPVGIITKPCGM